MEQRNSHEAFLGNLRIRQDQLGTEGTARFLRIQRARAVLVLVLVLVCVLVSAFPPRPASQATLYERMPRPPSHVESLRRYFRMDRNRPVSGSRAPVREATIYASFSLRARSQEHRAYANFVCSFRRGFDLAHYLVDACEARLLTVDAVSGAYNVCRPRHVQVFTKPYSNSKKDSYSLFSQAFE